MSNAYLDGQPPRLLDTGNPDDRDIVRYFAEQAKAPRGTFRCEISGGAMYATHRGRTVFLSHYRREGHGNCKSIAFGMSEEHKREQAYWARAGEAAGYDTTTEFRTSMVNNLDPRLVAAAFGRTAEGLLTYFSDRIDPTRAILTRPWDNLRHTVTVTRRQRLVRLLIWTDLSCGV